jgi:hypothetical protein
VVACESISGAVVDIVEIITYIHIVSDREWSRFPGQRCPCILKKGAVFRIRTPSERVGDTNCSVRESNMPKPIDRVMSLVAGPGHLDFPVTVVGIVNHGVETDGTAY